MVSKELSKTISSFTISIQLYNAINRFIKKDISNPRSKKSNNFFTAAASSFTYKKMIGKKNKDNERCSKFNPSDKLSV
ncbi:hypothetical protein GCM10022259_42230 [Aquimarina mytili]